jgi:hypothetical protein
LEWVVDDCAERSISVAEVMRFSFNFRVWGLRAWLVFCPNLPHFSPFRIETILVVSDVAAVGTSIRLD